MLRKFIISLIGVYFLGLFLLPLTFSNVIDSVCKNISANSEYEIEVKDPTLNILVFPTGKIFLKELSIKSKKSSISAKIENFKMNIRLLPLLSGRVHINAICVDTITLASELDKHIELDKDFFDKIQNSKIKLDALEVSNFEAKFYQKNVSQPIIYRGNDFVYQKKNRYIKLQNNSELNVAGNISKVTTSLFLPKNNDLKNTQFDVNISNINIAPLRIYFKHYLPKELKDLRGELNLIANKEGLTTEFSNCAILMSDNAKSIIFPAKFYVKSIFHITRDVLNIDNISLKSKNIDIVVEGKIFDYFSKAKPTLDLNVRINNSRVEDLIKMSPTFNVEELNMYALKKYKFYGDVLANFDIRGRLPEPELVGDIFINDGILVKPIPNTSNGAKFKINLAGKVVNFDVLVPSGGLEKVNVKGSQELYKSKYSDFIVKSSNSVNLKIAQDVLNPLHEILNFVIGPVPIMNINGNGNIDIIVKGNRKEPHIWGNFNAENIYAWLNDFSNLKLTNGKISLKFNDQKVIIKDSKALLNDKDFSIKGDCSLLGDFNLSILSNDQPLEPLFKAIKNSKLLVDINKMIPEFDFVKGFVDLNLDLYGNIKNIEDLKFNKNVFAKGNLKLKNNEVLIDNIKIDNANGDIEFDNLYTNAQITADIGGKPLKLYSKLKENYLDFDLDIPNLNPNFLISDLEVRKKQYLPNVVLAAKYKGNVDKLEYDKLNLKAKVLNSNPNSVIKYEQQGFVNILNNNIEIKNIKGFIKNKQNTFDINMQIDDAFNESRVSNGYLKFKTPNIYLYNENSITDLLPDKWRNLANDFELINGALDLNIKVSNNKITAFTDLSGISFKYLPLDLPVEFINGNLNVKNNSMRLNKINLLADNMPLLIDGDIKDILEEQKFNLYFNSKPSQDFIDKYINKKQIYPIKIKGDIVYWVKLKGIIDNYDLKAQINLSKDSSIYHFGATVGDIENALEVSIDSKVVNKNIHKIKEFSYDKMIDSLSGRRTKLNMLKAWGDVEILEDDLAFENLRIKTNHPTDARIFNIIFRKPNIKQGQFTSDLRLNGKLSDARILGDFHIFETNIPFLDTSMKNIELIFKDKLIHFASKGDVMGNDILFEGILKNKLTVPYKIESAYLYTKDLDLNQIINSLKIAEVENISTFDSFKNFDLKLIEAENFKIKADNIKLRNIHATNFDSIIAITENKLLDVQNFRFNIAQGLLSGKYSFDLNNNNMLINLRAENIDANDLSWALFDLNNQIYGDLVGDVNLACNGSDFNHCMETLNGNTIFNVTNGRMPKLGSLEYLLKASNLIKGGFTGLSINSVIDLISPSKTGEFTYIKGSIKIKDGVADNVEITTKGKDLSLYMGGKYNFATSIADMQVLGLLSRKISTILGPIGNVSINTLFNVIPGVDLTKDSQIIERINKIPGIELSSKLYRKFIAEIKGNINGEDYVTSFKWIN